MKAQLMGFDWTLGQGISLDDLFSQLQSLKGKPEKFGEYDRLIYVGSRGNYYVGLFLKIKDQRKSTEISQASGQFKVKIRELGDGNNLIDFNFFILNKTTRRGLYQYYHASCSLNQFCIFCSHQYDGVKDSKTEAAISALGTAPSGEAKSKVAKQFLGGLKWDTIVRAEKLEALLNELKLIKYFDFSLATITDSDSLVTPLKPWVKKNRRTLRFRQAGADLPSRIMSVIRDGGITRGSVGGIDQEGQERVYKLLKNPDKFAEYEYDEIAEETVFNLDDVAQSPFLDKMLKVIADDEGLKAMFETPAG